MHKSTLLLAAVCALGLAGCAGTPDGTAPSYRFADSSDRVVCLAPALRGEESLSLELRRQLRAKGLTVIESSSPKAGACRQTVRLEPLYTAAPARLRMLRLELDRPGQEPVTAYEEIPLTGSRGLLSPASTGLDEIRTMVDRLFPDPLRWTVP